MNEPLQTASPFAWGIWFISTEQIVNTNKIVYASQNVPFIMSLFTQWGKVSHMKLLSAFQGPVCDSPWLIKYTPYTRHLSIL